MSTPVLRVAAAGGTPTPVTQLEPPTGNLQPSHRAAQLLPGGEAILFETSKDRQTWENATIEVQSLKSGERKVLVQGGYFGKYISGPNGSIGHLIYMHGDTLFAAPMDVVRHELTSAAVPVVPDDVARRNGNGIAHLAVTGSGTLVYASGTQESFESLYWLDAAGKTEPLRVPPTGGYAFPRVSPDGSRIAVRIGISSSPTLGVYEWAANRMTRLSALPQLAPGHDVWAPDGKHLVVAIIAGAEGPGIYWVRADGAGEPVLLVPGQYAAPSGFSKDGKRLAFWRLARTSDPGLWTVSLDLTDPEHPKAGKPEPFLPAKVQVVDPVFSADGRWIAYTSAESGGQEIVVRPFPGPGGKWQVSTGGGTSPVWSPNSHELLYLQGRTVMAVPYTVMGDSFSAGQPRTWSPAPIRTPSGTPPNFDPFPDGQRILVTMPASSSADQSPGVTFLFNFADELRRKAPAK